MDLFDQLPKAVLFGAGGLFFVGVAIIVVTIAHASFGRAGVAVPSSAICCRTWANRWTTSASLTR